MGYSTHLNEAKKDLAREVHRLDRLGVMFESSPDGGVIVHHNSESSLVFEVKSKKPLDRALMELKKYVIGKFNYSFSLGGGGKS